MRHFKIKTTAKGCSDIDFDRELNEPQKAAVCAGNGPKLVIAGAGSGKTRTITYRVAFLLLNGMNPYNIMLATFTNKAAREMLRRVETLTGSSASKVWGGTFHSIANRILRHHARLLGYENNYSILDESDQKDLLKLCVTDIHTKTEKERFPSAALILKIAGQVFNTQAALEYVMEEAYPHFIHWSDEIKQILERYSERKKRANSMDYDDLLGNLVLLFEQHPDILEKYAAMFKYILVDEYQDTNKVQAAIIEMLAQKNGRNLMVVGDDSQSIYAFRGANYDNILKFPQRNPGAEVFKLEINYRSTPQILDFTNHSISHNSYQFKKNLTAVNPDGPLPCLVPLKDIYQEATFIREQILRLREEDIPLKEMAVLYRAHAHSMVLQAELIKANIPFEIRSGLRFFEQAHIKDVLSFIKVIENPFDEAAWRRLFLMLPRIGGATSGKLWERLSSHNDPLDMFLKDEGLNKLVSSGASIFWKKFRNDFRYIIEISKQQEPALVIGAVLETGYTDYLKSHYDNFNARIEDINQLGIFSKQYKDLKSFISELVLLGELYGEDLARGAETDEEKIVLSTVHQAKGLEWEAVFILRMCEGSFPSPMALKEEYGEEEERRIFYVATTRAKRELYLTYPVIEYDYKDAFGKISQPSRFIQEIDSDFYEKAEVEEVDEGYDSDEIYYSEDIDFF